MDIFNKVINDLKINYFRSSQSRIVKPFEIHGSLEPKNILLKGDKGSFYVGKNFEPLEEGCFYFVPANQSYYMRFGDAKNITKIGKEGLIGVPDRERFIQKVNPLEDHSNESELVSCVIFDVGIYNAFELFNLMKLPCFVIPPDDELAFLLKNIVLEEAQEKIGRKNLINHYIFEIIIQILRYVNSQKRFQKNVENLQLAVDKRLLNILEYIHENLKGDLDNETLADIGHVSEGYLGQFFKGLTGKTLQSYIENQRLEKAHELLQSQVYNVQEVSQMVGFNDAAYFSRRFKTRYGENAIDVKRKDGYDSLLFTV